MIGDFVFPDQVFQLDEGFHFIRRQQHPEWNDMGGPVADDDQLFFARQLCFQRLNKVYLIDFIQRRRNLTDKISMKLTGYLIGGIASKGWLYFNKLEFNCAPRGVSCHWKFQEIFQQPMLEEGNA